MPCFIKPDMHHTWLCIMPCLCGGCLPWLFCFFSGDCFFGLVPITSRLWGSVQLRSFVFFMDSFFFLAGFQMQVQVIPLQVTSTSSSGSSTRTLSVIMFPFPMISSGAWLGLSIQDLVACWGSFLFWRRSRAMSVCVMDVIYVLWCDVASVSQLCYLPLLL